jgi:hypothetical protein
MGQYDLDLNVCDVARSRTPRDLAKLVTVRLKCHGKQLLDGRLKSSVTLMCRSGRPHPRGTPKTGHTWTPENRPTR